MPRLCQRFLGGLVLAVATLLLPAGPASAVPNFAAQTGQPCTACHVGGYGPQLTPLGRAFKIGGYTQSGGEGWPAYVPLSAMVLTSFNNTGARVPDDQIVHHYGANNNFALDQISVFLAGGIGDHFGGFVQTTYDGIGKAFTWDNTDLRAVTTVDIKGANVVLGASLNNNPTVQDAWNTLPAWGYPYTD